LDEYDVAILDLVQVAWASSTRSKLHGLNVMDIAELTAPPPHCICLNLCYKAISLDTGLSGEICWNKNRAVLEKEDRL
jgi:hypothetical protein